MGNGAGRVILEEGCLSGGRWTGLSDSLLSLPDHPGVRRGPHLGRGLGDFCTAAQGRRGGPGEPGRVMGGCLSSCQPPQGEPGCPGEGGLQAGAAFSPCAWAPRAAAGSCHLSKGLWRSRGPPPRLQAPGLSGAFPEGHCISRVTVLGVRLRLPGSAPSRRASWKTTLRRLPQALRLVPAGQK